MQFSSPEHDSGTVNLTATTVALNDVTLPRFLGLAVKGTKQTPRDDPHLRMGLNVMVGKITIEEVSQTLDLEFVTPESVLAA
jgi:alanine dehydrogenase